MHCRGNKQILKIIKIQIRIFFQIRRQILIPVRNRFLIGEKSHIHLPRLIHGFHALDPAVPGDRLQLNVIIRNSLVQKRLKFSAALRLKTRDRIYRRLLVQARNQYADCLFARLSIGRRFPCTVACRLCPAGSSGRAVRVPTSGQKHTHRKRCRQCQCHQFLCFHNPSSFLLIHLIVNTFKP